ncbi:MAG: glycosyltransferase [Rhodothermaceae bacterium]|nr:glycosyltransferase [Rhodothermaceae bacterium]MYI84926.1 glycosyltransferase [Rhodothermaceae bacterium]
MAKLRALFIVQGEGRGHMTQALALASILRRAGHSICKTVVSKGGDSEVPSYFEEGLQSPVTQVPSGRFFVNKETRSVDWGRTILSNSFKWAQFNRSFAILSELLRSERPDVIVNFYEPLAGLFMLRERPVTPMVAVAHQFMFLHPEYQFPSGYDVQKLSTISFTRLTGLGAERRLALSLYDAKPLPDKKIVVMPPLLRDEFFELPKDLSEPFFLVYLFHHSLSKDVIAWHERNPKVRLHCFWNNDDAEEVTHYSDTLTFHRLHGQRFLDMMARCQGIVTTSGFESMAEAMYLGKPLMLNPLHQHFEQHCNGLDGTSMGAAVQTSDFNLDHLTKFVPDYNFDTTKLRAWIGKAETMFVRELEQVANNKQSPKRQRRSIIEAALSLTSDKSPTLPGWLTK